MDFIRPQVFLVILNWNGYADTVECIHSLEKVYYPNFNILVVDNGSTNDDYEKLRKNFPNIELIKSDVNLGFSGGNNLGIQYAMKQNPDFILLLNNDTVVTPDFIEPLVKVFENKASVGIVSPLINYYYEPNKIWSAGGKINRLRGSGISTRVLNSDEKEERKVEFLSGCCMLIPTKYFNSIGLFDDNYFLYSEDTDLCSRFLKAGKELYVSKNSIIYHKTKASTKADKSELALYYETRNRLYFVKKNYPHFTLVTFTYVFFAMMIKSIFWLFAGNFKLIRAVNKSISDFLKGKMGKTTFYKH